MNLILNLFWITEINLPETTGYAIPKMDSFNVVFELTNLIKVRLKKNSIVI